MALRVQRGFTLVELLAVIAIIGILVSILVPTVGVVRENARRLQCQNNAKEIGRGMLIHVNQKERFPGQFETVGKEDVTWFGKILETVGSQAQADLLKANNPAYVQYMSIAVCPSDAGNSDQAYLSFAANAGIWDQGNNKNDVAANGICHDLRAIGAKGYVGTENIHDGQSQTVLLAENVDATVWALPGGRTRLMREGAVGVVWPWDPNKWIGINFETGNGPVNGDQEPFARPSSRHSGGVNVVFADGHAKLISPDLSREVYGQLLSPHGARATVPWNKNAQIEFQKKLTLNETMYSN